ncbi:putative lysophospholipase [Diachasmimorpha longicaudata entomopoxvirus]|uniref:Putative lysophospholipase n=1 Tax=Diachasmimorpha longicaudata entomopoxvirus TaxID=109981 RepID=A0A7R5WLY2_9POXV|nr:putative lysophospholipase [Diachasmimorpha longicaudata entomopoxvirus]AKS26329.1 putative lysophospholipase [Diachasmimorpha longicaudata entomopoxvirus]
MIALPKLIFILIIIIILILYFIFAPQIPQKDSLDFSTRHLMYKNKILTISDIPDYLEFIESSDRYILPTEKKKAGFYNSALKEQTDCVLLYFHGFHSSCHEGRELIKDLSKRLEANYYLARFPGHGVLNRETSHLHVNLYHYLRDVYESLIIASLLGKKIILVGSSTGCTYAIWACSTFRRKFNIHSCIFFSPNIELYGIVRFLSKVLAWPLGEYFFSVFRDKILVNDCIVDHNIALQLLGILTIVRKIKKSTFKIPLLMFTCTGDTIVSHKAAMDFFNQIGSKHKHVEKLNMNVHQIINRIDLKDYFIETIMRFLPNII